MRNIDPYYLGNDTMLPTKLIVKTTDKTIEQDLHWDVSTDEMLDAFYTAMIGVGFHPATIIGSMKEFVEIHEENKQEDETI